MVNIDVSYVCWVHGENNWNFTLKRRDTIQCVVNFKMLCAHEIKNLEQICLEYHASYTILPDRYMYISLFPGPSYRKYHIYQIVYIKYNIWCSGWDFHEQLCFVFSIHLCALSVTMSLIWGTLYYSKSKCYEKFRQTSNIRRTKTQRQIFLVSPCSCLCAIHWSQVLSREWRCSWSSAYRRCPNYSCVINNYIAY